MEVISEKVLGPAASGFWEAFTGESGRDSITTAGRKRLCQGFRSGKSTVGVLRPGIHVAWNYFSKKNIFCGNVHRFYKAKGKRFVSNEGLFSGNTQWPGSASVLMAWSDELWMAR